MQTLMDLQRFYIQILLCSGDFDAICKGMVFTPGTSVTRAVRAQKFKSVDMASGMIFDI